jgi:S-DNA-T family DNA segregation ATPase FtsK/SpoIIIE
MSLRKKKKANRVSQIHNSSDSYIPVEKKKRILGLLLMVLAVLIFLSIISYSRFDEANLTDLYSVFGSDNNIIRKADSTRNWLGIFGAYVSDFFIKRTLGYFSIVLPIVLFCIGIYLFKKFRLRTLLYASNSFLLIGIILASFFGVLRNYTGILSSRYELSGNIGEYLGEALKRLLGGIGSIIFLSSAALIFMIIVFDIKIENIFSFFKRIFTRRKIPGDKQLSTVPEYNNLDKIKKLSEDKMKSRSGQRMDSGIKQDRKEEIPEDEEGTAEPSGEETTIRIVRKNDLPLIHETNVIQKEEEKKVDLEKTGEIPERDADREYEAELPNQWEEKINYKFPSLDLLEPMQQEDFKVAEEELKRNAELLTEKLKLFDIEIQDITVTPGPVVTLYEIVPAPGVKISRIVSLEHDIALALAARGIRIIAPIPGKSAIGVEIPNAEASLVNARSVLGKISESMFELPVTFGKTINGDVYTADLSKMPHLLIAGSTGSGKSVGINMIIASLLYSKHPSEVKLIMIDPKKIELSFYNKLRKHYLAVSPDLDEEIITAPQNAVLLLKSVEFEMEKRYDKLAKAGVRNIVDYNKKISDPLKKPKDTEEVKHHPVPYLIIIIDELADLMITAGKEVEEPIARLAQLARAVGIHLVLATQRPSVNVITGVIKANFSSRIAYQVATKIDSRTILDMNGAEALLGKGDMLFLPTGSPKPTRIQNAFISTEEVERLTNYIFSQPAYSKPYFLPSIYEKKKESRGGFLADLDPMFEDAARVIVRHQQGSVSLLQRRLKLGYSRAARIVDQLEEAGIVGPNDGSKARAVIVENEEQLETILRSL